MVLFVGNTEDNEAALTVTEELQTPQVSFQPINSALLGYPTMSSVSPSTTTILKSVVAFADYKGWYYAQVISDGSILGHHFVEQLKIEGSSKGMCIGVEHYNYPGESYQHVVDKIVSNLEARVLIVNLKPMDVMEFLKTLNGSNQAANFIVVSVQALSIIPPFIELTRAIRTPVYSSGNDGGDLYRLSKLSSQH